jgi:hypothetical protein
MPLNFRKRDVRLQVETLKQYLGRDAFFDTNRPQGIYKSPKFDFSRIGLSAGRNRFERAGVSKG